MQQASLFVALNFTNLLQKDHVRKPNNVFTDPFVPSCCLDKPLDCFKDALQLSSIWKENPKIKYCETFF